MYARPINSPHAPPPTINFSLFIFAGAKVDADGADGVHDAAYGAADVLNNRLFHQALIIRVALTCCVQSTWHGG